MGIFSASSASGSLARKALCTGVSFRELCKDRSKSPFEAELTLNMLPSDSIPKLLKPDRPDRPTGFEVYEALCDTCASIHPPTPPPPSPFHHGIPGFGFPALPWPCGSRSAVHGGLRVEVGLGFTVGFGFG